MKHLLLSAAALLLVLPASAQHNHDQAGASPYVDIQNRDIKALGASEMQDLVEGNGMGFALPAELNGFPGPKHALELADDLKLTDDQRSKTQTLFTEMNTRARSLGAELIEAERHLDQSFATKNIDAERLAKMTSHIGEIRGKLRAVHLSAHLQMMEILTESQVHDYNMARGYHSGH